MRGKYQEGLDDSFIDDDDDDDSGDYDSDQTCRPFLCFFLGGGDVVRVLNGHEIVFTKSVPSKGPFFPNCGLTFFVLKIFGGG